MAAYATVRATFTTRQSARAAVRGLRESGFADSEVVLMKGLPAPGLYTVAVLANDRFQRAERVLSRHSPRSSQTNGYESAGMTDTSTKGMLAQMVPEADALEQQAPWLPEAAAAQAEGPREVVPEADWLEQAEPVAAPSVEVAGPSKATVGLDVSEADYLEQATPAYQDALDADS